MPDQSSGKGLIVAKLLRARMVAPTNKQQRYRAMRKNMIKERGVKGLCWEDQEYEAMSARVNTDWEGLAGELLR